MKTETIFTTICGMISEIDHAVDYFEILPFELRTMPMDRLKFIMPWKISNEINSENFRAIREMIADELTTIDARDRNGAKDLFRIPRNKLIL